MRHLAREFSSNRRWYTCQSMPPSKKPSVWSRHIPRVMKNTWHIEKSIGKTLQKWSQKLSSSFSPVWHTSQTSKLFLFANLPLMKLPSTLDGVCSYIDKGAFRHGFFFRCCSDDTELEPSKILKRDAQDFWAKLRMNCPEMLECRETLQDVEGCEHVTKTKRS